MAEYKIPDEIRNHNRFLLGIRPFEAEGIPLQVLEEYESIIKIQHRGILHLRETNDEQRKRSLFKTEEKSLIGESHEIKRTKDFFFRLKHSDASVLIQAETGCGKELIAKGIQQHSLRWNKPFIKVNCSAFPESLFESELFGYEEGAFTGALKRGKKGLFEAANGGTIFLDEIGELPMSMQAKLLRVIQEQEITRIGGTEAIPVDVRIISATNQNLRTLAGTGKFRKDLYFRLNVIPIFISPLRDRKEDIPILANHFLQKYSKIYDTPKTLMDDAMDALLNYQWPGNVRELENLIERLFAWGTGERIDQTELQLVNAYDMDDPMMWYNEETLTLEARVAIVEKQAITSALLNHGTTRKAAKHLGISQATLCRRIQKYNIYIDLPDMP